MYLVGLSSDSSGAEVLNYLHWTGVLARVLVCAHARSHIHDLILFFINVCAKQANGISYSGEKGYAYYLENKLN